MNRAQRRQMMRANGFRGAKAKRIRTVPEVDDSTVRRNARALGLVVPPSVSELEQACRVG